MLVPFSTHGRGRLSLMRECDILFHWLRPCLAINKNLDLVCYMSRPDLLSDCNSRKIQKITTQKLPARPTSWTVKDNLITVSFQPRSLLWNCMENLSTIYNAFIVIYCGSAKVIYTHIYPYSPLSDTWNWGSRMRRECRQRLPRHRRLAIPTCITARAWRTCRDARQDG